MSAASLSSLEAPTGTSQSLVAARSYYNVVKSHSPPSAPAHLPEVVSMGAGRTTGSSSSHHHHPPSASLLSRPPSTQAARALPELAEDVYAPVPLRSPVACRVLPALPSPRGSFRADGNNNSSSNSSSSNSNSSSAVSATQTPSPDSVFRPMSLNLSTYGPVDREASTTSSVSAPTRPAVVVVGEETVKPLLCPPMRPIRAAPALGAAARTNPFCPEGVHVRHLPSCSPRVLSATRQHGRHHTAPTATAISVPHPPTAAASSAASIWDDAATEAEVLAFFAPVGGATDWHDADQPCHAAKETLCAAAAAVTPQSSICELSASEDMFSVGTASSEGSTGGGAHRSAVIDAGALAGFQRDGARRQREIAGLVNSNRAAH